MVSESDRRLVFAFLEYLQQVRAADSSVDVEQLDVVSDCLSGAFGVSLADSSHDSRYSIRPASLVQVFEAGLKAVPTAGGSSAATSSSDATIIEKHPELWKKWLGKLEAKGFFAGAEKGSPEYQDRYQKALAKFAEKFGEKGQAAPTSAPPASSSASPPPAPPKSKEDRELEAETKKAEGNAAMSAQAYAKAIDCYNAALELSPDGPNSHIYLSNKAAAQTHLQQYDEAIESCEKAIALNPSYGKAHSRMGYAYYQLGEYSAAVEAYRRSLELDPNNANSKEFLGKAEAKLNTSQTSRAVPESGGGGAPGGGMDLNSLLGSLGGGGGAGGLAGLMNNPMMMQMAQQMMNNPQMMSMAQNMMQNPQMMNDMLSGLGGGGGGGLGNLFGGAGPAAAAGGASSAGPDLGAMAALMNPENIQRLRSDPELKFLMDDPKIKSLFDDVQRDGPGAITRHLQDPEVMEKLNQAVAIMGRK